MTQNDVSEYFGKDLEAMSFAQNYHRWILSEFQPFLGGRVAEVGAGAGSFSRLLLQTGIDRLQAYEPSRNMFPLLQATLGADPRAEAINGLFCGDVLTEQFDTVLYVNVLEHIEDDAAELVRAHNALKPSGHLLVFVPALPGLYSEFDRRIGHFRRYRARPLAELARQAGFSVVKARYFDIAGIVPWYLHFTLLGNSMGSGSVNLYDRLVVPPMRFLEGLVAPPIGKNVLLVARKS